MSSRKITLSGVTEPPTLITAITKEMVIKVQASLNKGRNLRQRFLVKGYSFSYHAARDSGWEKALKGVLKIPLRLGPALTQFRECFVSVYKYQLCCIMRA